LATRPSSWVLPAFFWVVPTCGSLMPVSRLFNEFNQSLTRGRVGDAVWLVLSRFAFWTHCATRASYDYRGRRCPQCCQAIPRQGVLGTSYAVGVKLRRVGLITFASAAPTVSSVAGRRDAGVVWAGGLHSGWKARMTGWGSRRGPQKLRLVPLMKFSCCLPSMRLPSGGRGRAIMGRVATYLRIPKGCGAGGLVTSGSRARDASVWDPWGRLLWHSLNPGRIATETRRAEGGRDPRR
jgi:hypothetical protein